LSNTRRLTTQTVIRNCLNSLDLRCLLATVLLYSLAYFFIPYFPNGIFEDDAYFYFQIASNWLNIGYPTLDGFEKTNGYHPLWMLLLILTGLPAKLVYGPINAAQYTILFLVGACGIVYLISITYKNRKINTLAFVLVLYCGLGMETLLGALFLILIYRSLITGTQPTLWIAALVATRWDLLIAIVPLLFVFKSIRNARVILAITAGILFTMAAHYYIAGEIYSISAQIKASRAYSLMGIDKLIYNLSSLGNFYRYAILLQLNAIAAILLFERNSRASDTKTITYIGLIISSNAFVLTHTIVSDMRDWYFAPSLFTLAYIVAHLINNSKSVFINKINWSICIASTVGIFMFTGYVTINLTDMRASREFITNLDTEKLSNARVFAYDGSGYLAWSLSGVTSVTNGDGLVNSFEYYYAVVRPKVLLPYLKKNNIRYYIRNELGDPGCIGLGVCLSQSEYTELLSSRSARPYSAFKLYQLSD
jgi:hypothetical protein